MTFEPKSRNDPKNIFRVCTAVGGIGILLLVLGTTMVWSTGWGSSLLIPGATLTTVSLTAYVATNGIVSWAVQRDRDRETAEYKHREEVYERIATYMVARFLGEQPNLLIDGQLRTAAVLWGSPKTIEALGQWQSALSTVLSNHEKDSDGSVSMSPSESQLMKTSLGAALSSMRDDLASGQGSVEPEVLLRSIFND